MHFISATRASAATTARPNTAIAPYERRPMSDPIEFGNIEHCAVTDDPRRPGKKRVFLELGDPSDQKAADQLLLAAVRRSGKANLCGGGDDSCSIVYQAIKSLLADDDKLDKFARDWFANNRS